MATTPARMVQRRRTAAQWASENPVLAAGEIGIATGGSNGPAIKIGDGTTPWNSLTMELPVEVALTGGIKTGATPGSTVFGGFEREDIAFGGAQLRSAATFVETHSYGRYLLPATGTTTVRTPPFNCPHWFLASDIHLAVSNEHTTTGNVRIQTVLREVDVGTQALSAATVLANTTTTHASPGANTGMTIFVPVPTVTYTPGTFGSVYTVEISRLGDDGADTLGGDLGLLAIGFSRVDPP